MKSLDLEILKTDTLKDGIYMNFKEFQQNNPSIKGGFTIGNRNTPLKIIPNTPKRGSYLYLKTDTNYTRLKQKHWGFCYNNKVYVLFQGRYLKLSIDGKYCSFTDIAMNANRNFNTFGASNNHISQIPPSGPVEDEVDFLLNATNDERIEVTINNLEDIVDNEKILLIEECEKINNQKWYILCYINNINKLYKYK
jgi:hypothetical protein